MEHTCVALKLAQAGGCAFFESSEMVRFSVLFVKKPPKAGADPSKGFPLRRLIRHCNCRLLESAFLHCIGCVSICQQNSQTNLQFRIFRLTFRPPTKPALAVNHTGNVGFAANYASIRFRTVSLWYSLSPPAALHPAAEVFPRATPFVFSSTFLSVCNLSFNSWLEQGHYFIVSAPVLRKFRKLFPFFLESTLPSFLRIQLSGFFKQVLVHASPSRISFPNGLPCSTRFACTFSQSIMRGSINGGTGLL